MSEITKASRDFRKLVTKHIRIDLICLKVTVVKVLHFIDGVKLYVAYSSRKLVDLPHAGRGGK